MTKNLKKNEAKRWRQKRRLLEISEIKDIIHNPEIYVQKSINKSTSNSTFCPVLAKCMKEYQISQDQLDKCFEIGIQFVRTGGRFKCVQGHVWQSNNVWIKFDLNYQAVETFGQRCKKCFESQGHSGGLFHRPDSFSLCQLRNCSITAIKKCQSYMNQPLGDVNYSAMDVPVPITFFERSQLDEKSKGAHSQLLCQRCCTLRSPCWIPHKVSECAKCQKSRWKCCFDASKFLECCFVVNVKSIQLLYDYATPPKLMKGSNFAKKMFKI